MCYALNSQHGTSRRGAISVLEFPSTVDNAVSNDKRTLCNVLVQDPVLWSGTVVSSPTHAQRRTTNRSPTPEIPHTLRIPNNRPPNYTHNPESHQTSQSHHPHPISLTPTLILSPSSFRFFRWSSRLRVFPTRTLYVSDYPHACCMSYSFVLIWSVQQYHRATYEAGFPHPTVTSVSNNHSRLATLLL